MSDDWIKMRKSLSTDPDVIQIAEALGITEDGAIGILFRFWSWADTHLTNGDARGVTDVWIDRHVGYAGFCQSLISVGWLSIGKRGLRIEHFEKHMSESAKSRALAKNRMKRKRRNDSDGKSVTRVPPKGGTKKGADAAPARSVPASVAPDSKPCPEALAEELRKFGAK